MVFLNVVGTFLKALIALCIRETGNFTNSEDQDEMPYTAAFHQGLQYVYRSVPLLLVTLLREFTYSANLSWLPKFKKKSLIFTKLQICFAKALLFTLGINNACFISCYKNANERVCTKGLHDFHWVI